MTIKSLVKEVLSRDEPAAAAPAPQAADSSTTIRPQAPPVSAGGPQEDEELRRVLAGLKTNIKIMGCGGAGCNTVNRIVEEGIIGADMYALNSDAQHLLTVHSPHKILIGRRTTRGLGAGAVPQIGKDAASEAEDEIRTSLQGADLVFITCGLGGGTGTGSAPVVAKIAKEMGALTISIVTHPFQAEGVARAHNAEWGLDNLEAYSDTVIVIPNDRLLEIVPRLPLNAAFKVADELLMRAIKGITEMITKVGLVNLDFADLTTIMKGGGVAVIGLGEASDSQDKASEAVEEALTSPLLEMDISDAKGALICVTGGEDMSVTEAETVAEVIHSRINQHARIIWGAYIDPALAHTIRVMLVITGVRSKQISGITEKRLMEGGGGGRSDDKLGIEFIR